MVQSLSEAQESWVPAMLLTTPHFKTNSQGAQGGAIVFCILHNIGAQRENDNCVA